MYLIAFSVIAVTIFSSFHFEIIEVPFGIDGSTLDFEVVMPSMPHGGMHTLLAVATRVRDAGGHPPSPRAHTALVCVWSTHAEVWYRRSTSTSCG